jgi:hypothetical protein
MLGLLVAGLVFLVVGVLAIGFGIPIKEFSVGNTLIASGVAGSCTGVILIALSLLLRELKGIAHALAAAPVAGHPPDTAADPFATASETPVQSASGRDPRSRLPERAVPPADTPPPWQGEWRSGASSGEPVEQAEPEAAVPALEPKRRRNLLFRSSLRDRGSSSAEEPNAETDGQVDETPTSESGPSFREAWTAPERQRSDLPRSDLQRSDLPRRAPRAAVEAKPVPPPIRRPAESPPVTILKSGVVDGMAYSLYSDGSIEAQMPEGMVRFASIDELRHHLDQRT